MASDNRKQTTKPGIFHGESGWLSVDVVTSESWDEATQASKCNFRTRVAKGDEAFLDVSVEEYTGNSRRAKLCTVRLQEPAARELYAMLKARFEP